MRLPNPDQALIDIRKLRDYSLNPNHRRGKHKARLFLSILGLRAEDATELEQAIRSAIQTHEAIPKSSLAFRPLWYTGSLQVVLYVREIHRCCVPGGMGGAQMEAPENHQISTSHFIHVLITPSMKSPVQLHVKAE